MSADALRLSGRFLPTDVGAEHDVVDAVDLLSRPYEPPEFLVQHIVPRGGLVLLSADTGAGKTSLLLHASLSLAFGLPVMGRFGVPANAGPVLYLNGEMSTPTLARFLHANAAGVGIDVADLRPGRIVFEGDSGLASFFKAKDDVGSIGRLHNTIKRIEPSLLVFDTYRSLFEADESKAQEVRGAFEWLRNLAETYGCAAIVAHHLRKLSPVSNGSRERVSGSRDLVAAVDVHVALRSQTGFPVSALLIDKTRSPFEGVSAGTEFPVSAEWTDGTPPRSTFAAGEPSHQNSTPIATAEAEIASILAAEGPKTIAELDAAGGSRKRALDQLRQSGEVVPTGKRGRAILVGLKRHQTEIHDANELF